VRRVVVRRQKPLEHGLHLIVDGLFRRDRLPLRRGVIGYLAAVVGVALASLFIGIVQMRVHVNNVSLVYLLVVLWLAAAFGRGPAIAASFLAFLAYDFFFIPPLYILTVDDPTEWLSLGALLAVALVGGQMTAAVRQRAHEAQEVQQQTAKLYALAQLTVSKTNPEALFGALAERVLDVFAPEGVAACAIIVPDAHGNPITQAVAPQEGPLVDALSLSARSRAAQARFALEHGSAAGSPVAGGNRGTEVRAHEGERTALYAPLRSGGRVVGVLGIAGAPDIRRLVAALASHIGAEAQASAGSSIRDPQVTLFAAFCDQIALALDHLALEQEAIHAEALRESDRLKTALLGSVTHDLRTPIASIQAAAGSLLDPEVSWSEAERREFLETIETSADRLGRLVSNLLDLSRLEAGVAIPDKRWYPVGDVIATVLDRLDLAHRTSGRQIDVDVPEDLPLVLMDHAQIEQVLTNLIENALKYSPSDSAIRVQARVVGSPPELEVRVADHGVGIPPNELRAIFGKFYRVQHVRLPWAQQRPPTGTGLGLAISAGIVEAHGGRIWAESQLGRGATFIFRLPIPAGGPHGGHPELGDEGAQAQPPNAVPAATATPAVDASARAE
jgi:two-component system sensor histidine kinase KdpD